MTDFFPHVFCFSKKFSLTAHVTYAMSYLSMLGRLVLVLDLLSQ